jgi:MOSC domain-containing protein YiiM
MTEEIPVVAALHVAPGARLPLKALDRVEAVAGIGLVGDRYHGTRHRHVSVQSLEELAEAAAALMAPVPPEGTRRNVTLSHGRVPTAPGSRISLGDVELEVVRVAAPCRLLDDNIGPGAAAALRHRAGSICRVLVGGELALGDPAVLAGPPSP